MKRTHPLNGALVACTMLPIGWFTGVVRGVKLEGRGKCRRVVAVRVQRPSREASTPSASCRGEQVVVPLRFVLGRINRRKAWPHQIEPLAGTDLAREKVTR